jgi:hypothetical protein
MDEKAKTLETLAGLRTKIWTIDFPNAEQQRHPPNRDVKVETISIYTSYIWYCDVSFFSVTWILILHMYLL